MTDLAGSHKVCSYCGFTESDLKKTLRMGCPACYEVFAPELLTFLPRMHAGTTHAGKIPQSFQSAHRRLRQELAHVEALLSSGTGESDELLDRWRLLALQIEAVSNTGKETHEDS